MAKHFELGTKVKDLVTGVTGICVVRSEHLNGCVQYGIRQNVSKDGKVPETYWADSQQLTKVDQGIAAKIKKTFTGGPIEVPDSYEHP